MRPPGLYMPSETGPIGAEVRMEFVESQPLTFCLRIPFASERRRAARTAKRVSSTFVRRGPGSAAGMFLVVGPSRWWPPPGKPGRGPG